MSLGWLSFGKYLGMPLLRISNYSCFLSKLIIKTPLLGINKKALLILGSAFFVFDAVTMPLLFALLLIGKT